MVIAPYSAAVGLRTVEEIRKSLTELAALQIDEEKRLRLKDSLPRATLALDATDFAAAEKTVDTIATSYLNKIKAIDMAALQAKVDASVQAIVDSGEQLERFHGKKLLRAWYDKFFNRIGMGWNPFLIELARHASQGERLERLATQAINQIRFYFPPDLSQRLSECVVGTERDALMYDCDQERARWAQGKPRVEERETLRRRVIQYAHDTAIGDDLKTALVQSTSAIGTA